MTTESAGRSHRPVEQREMLASWLTHYDEYNNEFEFEFSYFLDMTVTRADIAAFLSPLEHSEEILGLLMPALYAPAVTPSEVADSTLLRLLQRA